MVDDLQPDDPLGGGDAAPARDEQPHRATVRRGQILAVHLPDEHHVRVKGHLDRQAALHLREVPTLGDDVDRAVLDAGHVEDVDQRDAGPLRVADCPVTPLRPLDISGSPESAPAVARAFEERGDGPRLHPLQVLEGQLDWFIDQTRRRVSRQSPRGISIETGPLERMKKTRWASGDRRRARAGLRRWSCRAG